MRVVLDAGDEVYPRACGGTFIKDYIAERGYGLSPRVRGNLGSGRKWATSIGSIPARAGEPLPSGASPAAPRVYPRACGGTLDDFGKERRNDGLSPRVRGNRDYEVHEAVGHRSIPARAGEPRTAQENPPVRGVYPRACGGTARAAAEDEPQPGLSPRVRGNRQALSGPLDRRGSIPARAGEPCTAAERESGGRVYPRACGGTSVAYTLTWTMQGLSPRVRGNLVAGVFGGGIGGSIPARAGEPSRHVNHSLVKPVYPRACGGTGMVRKSWVTGAGLSPRVRGNRFCTGATVCLSGSIPARAGEPA